MPTRTRQNKHTTLVRDRRGRTWTVSVMPLEENDDLDPWLRLSPAQRVELIGECVLDGLRVKGQSDVPRMQRVCRMVQRPEKSQGPYSRRKTRTTRTMRGTGSR
jgi:hypothetical protein